MKKKIILSSAILSVCTLATSCSNSIARSSTANLKDETKSNIDNENNGQYTIKFVNDDGTPLSSQKYDFGQMPVIPDEPTKPSDVPGQTYVFDGWIPSVGVVTGNQTYTASYRIENRKGNVTFYDGDKKTVISTTEYVYGSTPVPPTDVNPPSTTKQWVLKGWTPELKPVDAEQTSYYPVFEEDKPITQHYVSINCSNCLVRNATSPDQTSHKNLKELCEANKMVKYFFDRISDSKYYYPSKLVVKVDGEISTDYNYYPSTGTLNITPKGKTEIEAIADENSATITLQPFDAETGLGTIKINNLSVGNTIDWGDGTINALNSHTYTKSRNRPATIRIYGPVSSAISFTGDAKMLSYATECCINNADIIAQGGLSAFTNLNKLVLATTAKKPEYYFGDALLPSVKQIEFTKNITKIPDKFFLKANSFDTLILPQSNFSIGKYLFNDSSNDSNATPALTTIENFDYVTSIDEGGFQGCSNLTSVKIPESLTKINSKIFANCQKLQSVTISKNVSSINPTAFNKCNNLKTITVDSNNAKYDSREGCNAVVEKATNKLVCGCVNSTILTSIKAIGDSAFESRTTLKTIVIPTSVNSIGKRAFANCTSLASMNLTAQTIGDSAFEGCSKLANVTIATSVNTLGTKAFYKCTSLTSIDIPSQTIGESAFESCSNLATVTIAESVDTIKKRAFALCKKLASITIPAHVIGEYAFQDCEILENVTLSEGVKTIGSCAFANCKKITSIFIPASVEVINESPFYNCTSLTEIVVDSENQHFTSEDDGYICNVILTTDEQKLLIQACNLGFSTIPEDAIEIGKNAFANFAIGSIDIPPSVLYIRDRAFYNCTDLTTVMRAENVQEIGSEVFANCTKLTSVAFKNSIQFKDGVFKNCTSLTKFHMSNTTKDIKTAKAMFQGCTSLVDVTISNQLTHPKLTPRDATFLYLPEHFFDGCSSLVDIRIPDCIQGVRSKAFANCTSLRRCLFYFYDSDCEQYLLQHSDDMYDGCTKNNLIVWVRAFTTKECQMYDWYWEKMPIAELRKWDYNPPW